MKVKSNTKHFHISLSRNCYGTAESQPYRRLKIGGKASSKTRLNEPIISVIVMETVHQEVNSGLLENMRKNHKAAGKWPILFLT